MSETASKTSITIKKYANRRLYNTATSAYVTLEDLSSMVKEGTEFNVFDAKTSEDITRSVLTQIIVEEESKSGQQNLLPISFLRQLIGFYGDSLQWMVPKYLEQSMESLSDNQDRIREYFKSPLETIFPFGTTLEEMSKQNMAMFEKTMSMFSPFSSNLGDAIFSGLVSDTNSTPTATNSATSTKNSTATTQQTNICSTNTPTCCPISSNATNTNATTCETKMGSSPVTPPTTQDVQKQKIKNEQKKMATVTDLKPQNQNPMPEIATISTPMPNVQKKTGTDNVATPSDDMQQKIANLQRQLADLAKSRA